MRSPAKAARAGRVVAAAALAACARACSSPPSAFPSADAVVLQNDAGIALGGYDPVSYFSETGPVAGEPGLQAQHAGATYLFATAENRRAFEEDPERYAPAYGGWCAWAVADGEGSLVEVDPSSYLVQDGRLLLFYDGWMADTRSMWRKNGPAALAERADANWQRLLGTVASSPAQEH